MVDGGEPGVDMPTTRTLCYNLDLWTLSSCLAVCWPGAQSARGNHVLACNFAKFSPILFFSLTDSPINLS